MYTNEEKILKNAKEILANLHGKGDELGVVADFKTLANAYETLLADIKFITKISDRLQSKLNDINEELVQKTNRLQSAQEVNLRQNDELRLAKENLELKVAERTLELEKAYNEMLASNKELDTFVYRASHDLKGPIVSLIGLCNVALMEIDPNTKPAEYIEMLRKIAERMNMILLRLLSVNTLKNAEINNDSFWLDEVLEKTFATVSGFTHAEKIRFSFKYPEKTLVFTDENMLGLLVENLLEYAVKNSYFNERHSPFIEFSAIKEQRSLQFYMSYNGFEIPSSVRGQIFNMFHRTTNNPEHSGMELYTAHLATKRLNGNIQLISSTVAETLFSVFVPDVCTEPKE